MSAADVERGKGREERRAGLGKYSGSFQLGPSFSFF